MLNKNTLLSIDIPLYLNSFSFLATFENWPKKTSKDYRIKCKPHTSQLIWTEQI